MPIITQVAVAVKPWANWYNDNSMLQSRTMFVHLSGVLLSGGAAVTTERATPAAARRTDEDRARKLTALRTSHKAILIGLGATLLSRVVLLTADVETLILAPAFVIKMGVRAALLANGYLLTRAEGSVSVDQTHSTRQWATLKQLSYASLALCFTRVLASTSLATTV